MSELNLTPTPQILPSPPPLFPLVKCPNSLKLPLQLYFNQINLFALNALLDFKTRKHLSDIGCPNKHGNSHVYWDTLYDY